MNRLDIIGLSKTFAGAEALKDVSFAVAPGEFVSIIGPTNAGKSTLLKAIAGLHRQDRGAVHLDGIDVTAFDPRDRKVSLLFQNIALFPTLSGFDNIAYPLRLSGTAASEIARRVEEVARLVNVGHLLGRLPRTYSGGEQQRVAIGRALARRTRLLMLDEPLTNLDARLRIALRLAFKALRGDRDQSVLYVTHDQVEAMSLSDRIVVLDGGRVQQVGTPDAIYHRPRTRFVAEFVGTPPMNLFDAEPDGDGLVLAGSGWRLPIDRPAAGAARWPTRPAVGIRPEDIEAGPARSAATPLPGEVAWIERFGSRNVLDIRLGAHRAKVVVRPDHRIGGPGPAWFGFAADKPHLLDRDSGRFVRTDINT